MGVLIKLNENLFEDKNLGSISLNNRFLEYIQGDGASYIDTGFTGYRANWQDVAGTIPNDVPSIEIGFIPNKDSTQNILLGTLLQPQPIVYSNTEKKIYSAGKGAIFSDLSLNDDENILVYGAVTSSLNGTTIKDNSDMANQYRLNAYENNITLFAGNYNNAGVLYGTNKITYFKAYQGETLVLHLRPFIDSNGVVCMKDVLTDTLYYNQGTGNFK